MRNHLRRRANAVLGLLLSVAAVSCGDDQSAGPVDGTILVGTRTSGSDLDANGYVVSVNSGQGQEIGILDTIYVTALDAGEYVVSLGGIAANCAVPQEDNSQTATVVPGDTVDVLFEITCEPVTPPGGNDLLRMGL